MASKAKLEPRDTRWTVIMQKSLIRGASQAEIMPSLKCNSSGSSKSLVQEKGIRWEEKVSRFRGLYASVT